MILKRQNKDGIVTATYDSSNIQGSVYNATKNELIIVFKTGQYKYANVTPVLYEQFEAAESQGKLFNSTMKTLPFMKLEGTSLNPDILLITEDTLIKK